MDYLEAEKARWAALSEDERADERKYRDLGAGPSSARTFAYRSELVRIRKKGWEVPEWPGKRYRGWYAPGYHEGCGGELQWVETSMRFKCLGCDVTLY